MTMNHFKTVFLMLLFFIVMSAGAQANNNTVSSKFNFSYAQEGDALITPSQAFDDGTKIYLQFSQLNTVPELYLDDGQGKPSQNKIAYELQSPYIVVSMLAARIHLIQGKYHAVLVNQSLKQAKGLSSITQTIGALFASKKMKSDSGETSKIDEPIKPLSKPPISDTNTPDQNRNKLIFQVRDRQVFSQALRQFLETQGWRMEWNYSEDFIIHSGYILYGTSLFQLLENILSELKLSAKYSGNTVLVTASPTQ